MCVGEWILKRVALAVALSLSPPAVCGEYREFKSTDGSTIEAELVECAEAGVVTIRRRDGRTFRDVPLDRFSPEDRKFIREWEEAQRAAIEDADLTADSRIKVTVIRGRDEDMNNYGDIDDQIVKFEPGVIGDSDELEKCYRGVEGTLVLIGRGVIQRDAYAILSKQDFKLDFLPRTRTRWDGRPFQCRYDPDYGGFEYGGYLVVLRNKAGDIVVTRASKSNWEEHAGRILKARKRTGYDRDFEGKVSLFTTFGLPQ